MNKYKLLSGSANHKQKQEEKVRNKSYLKLLIFSPQKEFENDPGTSRVISSTENASILEDFISDISESDSHQRKNSQDEGGTN